METVKTEQAAAFLADIDRAVARHDLLKHPFYQAWNEGTLELETLARYASQYYAHVHAFPTYVSAVHSRCGDLGVRQMLLQNLIEEESGPQNHPELWMRFAEGLGVKREQVEDAELLPQTQQSVESMRRLTASPDYLTGVAALYAYESQVPEVSRTKREGLSKFYGIDDPRSVAFFTVHEEADQLHRSQEREILAARCRTPDQRESAVQSAGEAAGALWSFLDGVWEAYAQPCH